MQRFAQTIAVAVVALPIAAHAGGGPSTTTNSNNNHYENVTDNWNTITNNHGGAGGSSSSSATGGASDARARSGSESAASSNNAINYTNRVPRQAPSTGGFIGAAPCVNGGGLWGSGPGFSVGGALNRVDADCHDLNVAMFLSQMGRPDLSLALLLQQPRVRQAAEIVANSPNQFVPVAVAQPYGPGVVAMEPRPNPPVVAPRRRPVRRVAAAPCSTNCPAPQQQAQAGAQ